MLAFDALLAHLEPAEVRELVLESGVPPTARTDAGARVLHTERLSLADLERLCAEGPLAELLADAREIGVALGAFERGGFRHPVQVELADDRLVVRIARDRRRRGRGATELPTDLPPTPRRSGRPTVKPTRKSVAPKRPTKPPSARSSRPPEERRAKTVPPGRGRVSPLAKGVEAAEPRLSAAAPDTIRTSVTVPPSRKVRASALLRGAGLAELERLVGRARAVGATDAHVAAGLPPWFRRAGELAPDGPPISADLIGGLASALLDGDARARLESRGSITVAAECGASGRARVTILRSGGALECVVRPLARGAGALADLGAPEELGRALAGSGLVLFAGPPGAGCSTTLAAAVAEAAGRGLAVTTLEEPVEILVAPPRGLVAQVPLRGSVGAAVRSALRADADVVALHVATREALDAALEAVEAGRLVLATAPGATVALALERLLELGGAEPDAALRGGVASALRFVSAQRVIPSVDGARLHAAFEFAAGGGALATMIRDAKLFQLPSLFQRGRAHGALALEEALRGLIRSGAITVEAARAAAADPKALEAEGHR